MLRATESMHMNDSIHNYVTMRNEIVRAESLKMTAQTICSAALIKDRKNEDWVNRSETYYTYTLLMTEDEQTMLQRRVSQRGKQVSLRVVTTSHRSRI